ncbi:MAG: thermonuclease family protein [Gammaproteobacteria bacterium]
MLFLPGSAVGWDSTPEPVLPATLVKVVDGDTIKVRLDSGPITVRLHGIDTPERNEALGPAATKALRNLLEGEPLELEVVEQRDAYDRLVAKVFARGRDVNAQMVESGYAWAYRRYLRHKPADEAYCTLEAAARDARRGVWSGDPSGWEPPWSFRARGRARAVPSRSYATETAAVCMAAIGRNPPTAAGIEPFAGVASGGNCRIKGNISGRGQRIYHLPGSPAYAATLIDVKKGERWFCSPEEAERAGWRAPGKPGSAQLR